MRGWKLEDRNPMDALIQFGVEKLSFFHQKKQEDLRCCIHQVIGCGEALLICGFFLGVQIFWAPGVQKGESPAFLRLKWSQVEDDSVKFSRGGQQMSGEGRLIRLRNSQMRSGCFFSVVPPTPPEIWRIDTYPKSRGFVRCISFRTWQFLGINSLNFSGCKSCLHVYTCWLRWRREADWEAQITRRQSGGDEPIVAGWSCRKECHW